jgi:hypothetical protein
MKNCIVCKTELLDFKSFSDTYYYDCPRCGKFSLTGTLERMLPSWLEKNKDNASLFSYLLRKMQARNNKLTLDSELFDELIATARLPTPSEQAKNFLRWLGKNVPSYDASMEVEIGLLQSIMGAQVPEGVFYVTSHLDKQGYIISNGVGSNFGMTFDGWEEYERLTRQATDSRVAFMAMQFNDDDLTRVVNDVFRPAVEAAGFELRVLTDNPSAGLIDDRLRVEIRNSKFLIADLTHRNPGAYWEAGFAEGLGKPVIYTCKKEEFDKVVHFDTNHHLTVMWDVEKFDLTAAALKATIRATLPDESKMSD